MRFRLRTLLIVVTLACLYLAWVAFMRQCARFHRTQSADLVERISTKERYTAEDIETGVRALAVGKAPTQTTHFELGGGPDRITVVENSHTARIVNEDTINEWHQAIFHRRMANFYDRSTVQPWGLLTESPAP